MENETVEITIQNKVRNYIFLFPPKGSSMLIMFFYVFGIFLQPKLSFINPVPFLYFLLGNGLPNS